MEVLGDLEGDWDSSLSLFNHVVPVPSFIGVFRWVNNAKADSPPTHCSLALGVLWILQSSQPSLSLYSAHSLAFGTSYYSISLSVNILLTILIIVRLLIYRKKVMQILPAEHTKQYLSIATIIVESASLYSVFALIFLVTYAVGHPVNGVFMVTASASQVQ